MTIKAAMILLGDIIQKYMSLEDDQIVLYSSDWKIPDDNRMYIIISYSGTSQNILNIKSEFNSADNTETMSMAAHERFTVDIMQSGDEILETVQKIFFALKCQNSISLQETNNISIWREGKAIDLTAIEGAGALRRYQIPVIISNVQSNKTAVDYFDKFAQPQTQTED
jgi:hypothetical protein